MKRADVKLNEKYMARKQSRRPVRFTTYEGLDEPTSDGRRRGEIQNIDGKWEPVFIHLRDVGGFGNDPAWSESDELSWQKTAKRARVEREFRAQIRTAILHRFPELPERDNIALDVLAKSDRGYYSVDVKPDDYEPDVTLKSVKFTAAQLDHILEAT